MDNITLKTNIQNLINELDEIRNTNIKAVMGLDGFVDQILHAVKTRTDAEHYTRMETLKDFGEFILRTAGLSGNIEFVPLQAKLGGNGPIMSNALSTYGLDITYIGALGVPSIHPVFQDMSEKCNIISIANPGLTDAVEFLDGKLMIGKRECLKDINWDNLLKAVSLEKLTSLIENASFVGLENWTMLPHMTSIWRGIISEVLPKLSSSNSKYIFFDLADPENRLKEDILDALEVIKEFSSNFKVILGLNKKEAHEIAVVLDLETSNFPLSLADLTTKIAKKINLYCLVVHPVKEAACVVDGNYYHTFGPFEPNPKLTTGAGDNFNAGFCFGQVLGLNPTLSLVLGTATSGYYVRNAKSPTSNDIKEFLISWRNSLN